jgi:cyclic pyranopterin phosphate synthase
LNCIYCHREGEDKPGKEIDPTLIHQLAHAFHEKGVRKVKITGGEPLMRTDLPEIINELPEFEEISITTNGTMLADIAYELKEVGVNRVNVSLDTMDPDKYRYITGKNVLDSVIDGIEESLNAGLTPVKVNMVLLKGINDDEIDAMMEFVRGKNAILQLIELLDFGDLENRRMDMVALEESLARRADRIEERYMHRRKKYYLDGCVIEVVRPMDNSHFCKYCNRIRITSDGKIKPCLMRNDNLVDTTCLKGSDPSELIMEAVNKREPFFKEVK